MIKERESFATDNNKLFEKVVPKKLFSKCSDPVLPYIIRSTFGTTCVVANQNVLSCSQSACKTGR